MKYVGIIIEFLTGVFLLFTFLFYSNIFYGQWKHIINEGIIQNQTEKTKTLSKQDYCQLEKKQELMSKIIKTTECENGEETKIVSLSYDDARIAVRLYPNKNIALAYYSYDKTEGEVLEHWVDFKLDMVSEFAEAIKEHLLDEAAANAK